MGIRRAPTLKDVGVPLTGMGRAAAAVLVPVTGSGAVSPVRHQPRVTNHSCMCGG